MKRCEIERQRSPITWTPLDTQAGATVLQDEIEHGTGSFYSIDFPTSEQSLLHLGVTWLNNAMKAAGTLPADNSIESVRRVQRLANSFCGAMRILLTVAYEDEQPTLHERLIVKMSSGNSSDSDRKSGSDCYPFTPLDDFDYFAEINFYRLYEDRSPYAMPKFYYGDISRETGNSVLVTEFIPSEDDIKLLKSPKFIEVCFIEAPNNMYLSCSASGKIETSKIGHRSLWKLECLDTDGRTFRLQAENGRYLHRSRVGSVCGDLVTDSTLPREIASGTWTLVPQSDGDGFHFKNSSKMYLVPSPRVGPPSFELKEGQAWKLVQPDSAVFRLRKRWPADLKNMGQEKCECVIRQGAQLAGMYKAGRLGPPEIVDKSFCKPAADVQVVDGPLSNSLFLQKAAKAQDFMLKVAPVVLSAGDNLRFIMKEYRSMLTTAASNSGKMMWFSELDSDYVALGRDRMFTESGFTNPQSLWSGGLRDWEGMSVGPLGSKIWEWLRYADRAVFEKGVDCLLQAFIEEYKRYGGPELAFPVLRMQFVFAAAIDSVVLLDSVPGILEACPLQDILVQQSEGRHLDLVSGMPRGSLWLCAKSVANLVWLLKTFNVIEMMHASLTWIIIAHASISEPLIIFQATTCTSVREEPNASSAIVTFLQPGFFPTCFRSSYQEGAKYISIHAPVRGWIQTQYLKVYEGLYDQRIHAGTYMIALMNNTRTAFTGAGRGTNVVSAVKLYDEILQAESSVGLITELQRGQPRVVHGSFLSQTERCEHWPEDYEHWTHHSFVAFEDDSIADISADTFDTGAPQIWWLADKERYAFDSKKAEQARFIRDEVVGLEKFQELSQKGDVKDNQWGLPAQIPKTEENGHLQKGTSGKARNASASIAFRHGKALDLPTISKCLQFKGSAAGATVQRLSEAHELEVSLIQNLFSSEELDFLVHCCKARDGFQPSLVSSKVASGTNNDNARTSWSCAMLWHEANEDFLKKWRQQFNVSKDHQEKELQAVVTATKRVAEVLQVQTSHIEPLQLVKYTPGQFFKPHLDSHQEPERASSMMGEQRTRTLLVFLNDVPASDGGGFLHFPLLKLRILPRKGSAVLWNNVHKTQNGTLIPSPESLHEGEATKTCEKYAMNIWVVDRPLRVKVKAETTKHTKGKRSIEADLNNAQEEKKHIHAASTKNQTLEPSALAKDGVQAEIMAGNIDPEDHMATVQYEEQRTVESECEEASKRLEAIRTNIKLTPQYFNMSENGQKLWKDLVTWSRGESTTWKGQADKYLGKT